MGDQATTILRHGIPDKLNPGQAYVCMLCKDVFMFYETEAWYISIIYIHITREKIYKDGIQTETCVSSTINYNRRGEKEEIDEEHKV